MRQLLMILLGAQLFTSCKAANEYPVDNSTVKSLDIHRFMGKWYEIARYENRFEKGMYHVTATYELQPGGRFRVLNAGYKNGSYTEAIGKGKQPESSEPGKLKVAFFLWFYADYYILYIDKDYRYALIGSSSDKYLWVMSREPVVASKDLKHLLSILRTRGYDTRKLIFRN